MANTISWKKRFAEFYEQVAESEPEEDSQLGEILIENQELYFDAADKPKASLRCSVCGSSEPLHLQYVIQTGRCVV